VLNRFYNVKFLKRSSKVLFLVLASVLLSNVARAATDCKYEENCECSYPGITQRWAVSFCAAKLEVNVEENMDKIASCIEKAKPNRYPKMDSCAKNKFWRKSLCILNKRYFQSERECMTTQKGIPRMVGEGLDLGH